MKSKNTITINLAAELRSGRHYGVFIDDTGSPGLVTPGLHEKRKSWVAVIVPPHRVVEVMDQAPRALSVLRKFGLEDPEFHFTDIWAGKGEFKKLSLEQRLGLFEFMAHIFATYRFEVLVQTFDPDNASDVRSRANWPEKFGPLKFASHEDLALIFALLRVHIHLKDRFQGRATACVIVDEWSRFQSGTSMIVGGLAPTFVGGAVLFASSRLVHPVQLADFAAFVLNRWQLLRVKDELTDLDRTLLKILTPVTKFFVNTDTVEIQGIEKVRSLRDGMN